MPVSPFTSAVTKVLDQIPGAEGHTVTIRMLNGKRLRKAADASMMAALEKFKQVGGAAVLKEIEALGGEQAAREKGQHVIAADPLQGYDRDTLIEGGVLAWTFEEPLTRDAIENLREGIADYLAAEILALAKPARTAVDQKND